jgi:hypothetical protein
MTSARRCGKSFAGAPAALLGLGLLCAVWAGGITLAATTERVVTNPRTGLAVDGFDPVAYFTDGTAKVGLPEFELRYGGAIWRFRNPGNRAAFQDSPGDYEPRFGGYDPVAIGRGAPTPGNPEIWLVAGQQLYLFYDPQTREEFSADPRRIVMQAEARWPDVVKRVLSE